MIDYLKKEKLNEKMDFAITREPTNQVNPKFEVAKRVGNIICLVLTVAVLTLVNAYPELAKMVLLYNVAVLLIRYIFEPVLKLDTFIKNMIYGIESKFQVAAVLVPIIYISLIAFTQKLALTYWIEPSLSYLGILFAIIPLIKFSLSKKRISKPTTNQTNVIKFRKK